MKIVNSLLIIVLCSSLAYGSRGNTFDHVRYSGGTVATIVGPKDWSNELTVTSDMITLKLNDGEEINIQPNRVTSLSYGQEAHRREGTMIALGILINPLALFGLTHMTRLHFIGLQYTEVGGKKAALLLQGHKNNYRAILVALQGVTGKPVSVGEKDREFVPVDVTTRVVKTTDTY
jgi:hypothetical protein